MNAVAISFVALTFGALLIVKRKWAPLPLLITCCFMTADQGIQLGPVSLPVYRMALAMGLIRVVLRRERFAGPVNAIDKLMVAWAGWVFVASLFHEWQPGSGPVYAAGLVFNIGLVYFLIRTWCQSIDDAADLMKAFGLILVPVALEMAYEQVTGTNLFLSGDQSVVWVREGVARAQGAFRHPILAGTVGAVCFPLMLGIWRRYRAYSLIGLAACLTMVAASGSSGPLMSLMFGAGAVWMWYGRHWLRVVLITAVAVYLSLSLVMTRPAYFIISKIDLTGSSTGWHRARLIQASIEYFSEWMLFGTDRTIHWIGVASYNSAEQSDITNYYILIGVIAGFPATLLLLTILWKAFRCVGSIVRSRDGDHDAHLAWCFGAGMFAHAVTSISVAYFDQSLFFFWMNVAIISSLYPMAAAGVPATTLANASTRRKPAAFVPAARKWHVRRA